MGFLVLYRPIGRSAQNGDTYLNGSIGQHSTIAVPGNRLVIDFLKAGLSGGGMYYSHHEEYKN
jgi:hypothetical protein